jgi:hypothetical protein
MRSGLRPALDAGFFIFWGPKAEVEGTWKVDGMSAALTGSEREFFDNRKAGKSTPKIST